MSDGFLVDVPGLEHLMAALSEAAEAMRAATGRLRAASAADLGSGDLDRAAGDFQDRWEYGIGKISDASEEMANSLREAKQLYEQTDQAIAARFGDPGSPGPASTPDESSLISRALDGRPAR